MKTVTVGMACVKSVGIILHTFVISRSSLNYGLKILSGNMRFWLYGDGDDDLKT